jgi:hypothetical protein
VIDYEVARIPEHRDAVAFITEHHYAKSAPNTSTYRFGLYDDALTLLGASIWIPPTRNAAATVSDDWQAVLSLSRFALAPELPKNTASYFLGRQMRLIDRDRWPVLLTYADEALGHTGGIYKATNWTSLGSVPAGDVWIGPAGERRGRKRGQRTWTRAEMVANGFVPAPKANKVKFVHRAAS